MKPEELFGVVVRTIGLLIAIPSSIAVFTGILFLFTGAPPIYFGPQLLIGTPMFIFGAVLLRGASPLIKYAYDNQQEE